MDLICFTLELKTLHSQKRNALSLYNKTKKNISHGWDALDLAIPQDFVQSWGFIKILTQIVIPSVCIFGLVGNFLSILVFAKRVSIHILCHIVPTCAYLFPQG